MTGRDDEPKDRTVTVSSPVAGYSGDGPAGIRFEGGRAEVAADAHGPLAYFRDQGYGVGDQPARPPAPMEAPDSREVEPLVHTGTALRDAAVDPAAGDFLAPIGAGEQDPHGRRSAAPGIHASGPGPVPGGQVADELDVQARDVTDAARVLVPQDEQPASRRPARHRGAR